MVRGGFASKSKCIKNPSDAKGHVMRAAGKAFNQMLEAAGVKLVYMSEKDHAAWVEIAKQSSHKAFAEKVPGGDKLMEMALAVK